MLAHFATFYICLVLFAGRTFTALPVGGPLYVNDYFLLIIFLSNLTKIKIFDASFYLITGLFIMAGIVAHGSLFWAARDMISFIYLPLLFLIPLTCTPKNTDTVFKAALFSSFFYEIFYILNLFKTNFSLGLGIYDFQNKYDLAIIHLFVILALKIKGKLDPTLLVLLFFILAIPNFFKTELFIALTLPLFFLFQKHILKLFNFKSVLLFCIAFYFLASQNLIGPIMNQFVIFLQSVTSLDYALSNSIWRSNLWNEAGNLLQNNHNLILWGNLPGDNFLALISGAGLIGDTSIGGDNRSSHNLIVDLLAYTGVIGLCSWFFFFFKWISPQKNTRLFFIIIIIYSMTNTIFTRINSMILTVTLGGVLSIIEFHQSLTIDKYNGKS